MTLNKILKLHHLNTLQKFQIRFYHSRLKLSHSMSAKVESVQTVRSGPSAADEVLRTPRSAYLDDAFSLYSNSYPEENNDQR